jgi:hypothetical protein
MGCRRRRERAVRNSRPVVMLLYLEQSWRSKYNGGRGGGGGGGWGRGGHWKWMLSTMMGPAWRATREMNVAVLLLGRE